MPLIWGVYKSYNTHLHILYVFCFTFVLPSGVVSCNLCYTKNLLQQIY